MSAAVLVPVLAALVVVLVAVVALVVVLRSARRRREQQEHRPLDPSVIECFPTGYQPPARPRAKGETPDPPSGRRLDDPAG